MATNLTSNGIPEVIAADDGGSWILEQDAGGEISTCTVLTNTAVITPSTAKSSLDLGHYLGSVQNG
jgi:hypothetical protein